MLSRRYGRTVEIVDTTAPAAARPVVTVDIYSDVVCPWCYIGKRKFEAGLHLVETEDLGVDFQVAYRPYQLDPTAAPGISEPVIEAYAKKFGGPERARAIIDNVSARAAEVGIEFDMERARRANTLLAHRLIWFAGRPDTGVEQAAMKERLLQAYFTDGLDIGDPEVLADCAADVGIDRPTALEFLASDRGRAEVAAELDEARDEGITAVPTYVFRGQWAVPGAQEPETFAQVLRKMANDATSAPPA
jgi:predicted DsbA family dithiol-disulfide isomerase